MSRNIINRTLSLVQYVSDLHLESKFSRNIIPQKPFLLLLGDIGYPHQTEYKVFLHSMSNYFDKVYVISGNHEYDNTKNFQQLEEQIENICKGRNNLFYLQKKTELLCSENKIFLAGCTLWSKFPKSKYEYHLDHKNWLFENVKNNQENNYIIATHHCPLFECLSRKFHSFVPNYFATDQSEILLNKNVHIWLHGHSHINNNFEFQGKPILSNQYGKFKNPIYGYKTKI